MKVHRLKIKLDERAVGSHNRPAAHKQGSLFENLVGILDNSTDVCMW